MAKLHIRHLVTRPRADGSDRHYWSPAAGIARAGWKMTRLSDERHIAAAQAEWINRLLDAWRIEDSAAVQDLLDRWAAGEGARGLAAAPYIEMLTIPGDDARRAPAGARTVGEAIDRYTGPDPLGAPEKGSAWWRHLRPTTRRYYNVHLAAIRHWAGDVPVARLTRSHLVTYYEALEDRKSITTASARLRVMARLMSYASQILEWRPDNPAAKLGLSQGKPRVAIVPRSVEEAYLDAAYAADRPSLAAAIVAAADLGLRREDLLLLSERQWDGGGWRVRVEKSGGETIVYPRITPRLKAALDRAAEHRRRTWPDMVSHFLFIDERTGRSWNRHTFAHVFSDIRAEAAKTHPDAMAYQFRDLRDTCVTRTAIAGTTIAEIASVTGHSVASIYRILRHYLGADPEMAVRSAHNLVRLLEQVENEHRPSELES